MSVTTVINAKTKEGAEKARKKFEKSYGDAEVVETTRDRDRWSIRYLEGKILADREKNYHDDSDFYVVYWDEKKQKPGQFDYATTRFHTEGCFANVDATEDIKEKFSVWQKQQARNLKAEDIRLERKIPRRGKTVELTRKINKRKPVKKTLEIGLQGVVIWEGTDHFSGHPKIGFVTADGEKYFVRNEDVKVIAQKARIKTPEPEFNGDAFYGKIVNETNKAIKFVFRPEFNPKFNGKDFLGDLYCASWFPKKSIRIGEERVHKIEAGNVVRLDAVSVPQWLINRAWQETKYGYRDDVANHVIKETEKVYGGENG